jgi:hypothetical protein
VVVVPFILGWLVAVGVAQAGAQKSFDVDKGSQTWDFDVRWKDDQGPHDLTFSLPADVMEADKEERTWLPRKELNEHAAKAVRQYGKTVPDVKLKAKVAKGGVQIEASGPKGDAKKALKEAGEVRDRAVDEWLAANGFTRLDSDGLSFDHALLASQVADDLRPVADALKAQASGQREYTALALSFVQSIPYEARKKNGGDPGYRRPLTLISRNRGDCDSKSVLFLGLVRAAYPSVPLAVIYVPGHALTGVGFEAEKGEQVFKADGTTFLYAEPVGPALTPLGQTAPENKKAGKKGEVRVVPS